MNLLSSKISEYKLSLSFLLIIALFVAFGVITMRGLFTLGKYTRTIYEHPLVVSNASLIAALNITKMHRSMKDVVLSYSPDELAEAKGAVAEAEQVVYQQLNIVRAKILGKGGQSIENQTRNLFVEWKPIRDEVVQLLEAGNRSEAIAITKNKGAVHVAELEGKMLELTSYARLKADNFLKAAESSQARLETVTVFLTLAGVFFCVFIAIAATFFVTQARRKLQDQKDALQRALDEIKTLQGIIPICTHCKQIRDDKGLWNKLEEYIRTHSDAELSHGICPSCLQKHYPEYSELILSKERDRL